jgi:uncharacterized membrane protein YczE
MTRRLPLLMVVGVSALLAVALLYLPQLATSEFTVVLGGVVLFGLTTAAVLDGYAVLTGRDTIGDGIRRTTRRFGLYRAGISLFLGALLGHFFWPSP